MIEFKNVSKTYDTGTEAVHNETNGKTAVPHNRYGITRGAEYYGGKDYAE